MKAYMGTRFSMVAGRRRASSTQPLGATSYLTHRYMDQPTPQPASSPSFFDASGALRQGLRCLTAFRPLPDHNFLGGKSTKPWRQ
jgi:hypothetical protein